MKKILTLICTLLCANVLLAQTRFWVGDLQYEIIGANEVKVYKSDISISSIDISNIVVFNSTTYYVTTIGENAFANCSYLTSVIIPDGITSIEYRAFYFCTSLSSIVISNSVSYIGGHSFYNCNSLTSITIPNNVSFIGNGAFQSCDELANIICLSTTVPLLGGSEVFSSTPSNKTLTVPCGSVEAYRSSSAWNSFSDSNIQGFEFNIETNVNNINYGSVAVENNCSTATLTANPTICSQFVRWNDGNTDNPRTINLVSDTSFTALFEEIEFNTELSATICEGSVYTENNFNVNEAGVYTQTLTSVNGCDSIVTLTLNINPIYNTELTAT
ncbi:MAG: leucine-rich repeat domain-containing protein, partial [Bacteroidales bacterium]|nr:leucine-rich repeat domain-containing protein [Bacteroidales bacterium]